MSQEKNPGGNEKSLDKRFSEWYSKQAVRKGQGVPCKLNNVRSLCKNKHRKGFRSHREMTEENFFES